MNSIYTFAKTSHILFVMGWMACLFVMPRVLVYWRKINKTGVEAEAIKTLCIRLFRFGSLMAVLAIFFGIWLWQSFGLNGKWLHYKMSFVGLLVMYHFACGWLLFNAVKLKQFKSNLFLRIFNESSLLMVVPIIYLVVSKNA